MDLLDLDVFRAVANEGGIIRASRKLHRVPSNVSKRIQQLEAILGARLFYRSRQRLFLSPSGELLLSYANRLLQLADEARTAVSGHQRRADDGGFGPAAGCRIRRRGAGER
jgi:DNA-binding transcriptional LysR family regulator